MTFLLCVQAITLNAQDYVQTPVSISKDKVRGSDGNIYYSHVVKEKQTLFSVAKAYGVSVEDICKANPAMNLKSEGLKNNSIILIPLIGNKTVSTNRISAETGKADDDNQDYFIHVVKWYEDLKGIAKKYNVPVEDIIKFNNLKDRKVKSRMKLMIPSGPLKKVEIAEETKAEDSPVTKKENEVKAGDGTPSISEQLGSIFNWNVFNKKSTVNALLMLPIKAQGNQSESNMDFYCGVLTALKDLEEEGISTDLSIYDVAGGVIPVTAEKIKSSDIIIGPVAPADISKVISINQENTPVVSPLDPKAESLVKDNKPLVQVPIPYSAQYKDIAEWVASDKARGDNIILVAESAPKNVTVKNSLINALNSEKVTFSSFCYNILQGRQAVDGMSAQMTNSGINRVVIASDSEAFVYDVVRNLNLIKHKGIDVVIYSPAKIRSFDTIEIESLHNLNLHSSSSYFIDYDAPEVKKFLLAYRALYNTEPSQFAFQGYDIAHYFISTCSKYGNGWRRQLSTRGRVKMLQSDFMFIKDSDGGYINNGIRRVVYEKDYTIRLGK